MIVSGCEGATQRYRCHHQLEQLWLRGIPARLVQQGSPNLLGLALGSPIVILHRVALDRAIQGLMVQTRDAGGVVLFDIDDLVFDPEQTHWHHGVARLSAEEARLYHDGVRRYRQTLLASDGAILATDFLAGEVRRLGKPAWVSRNCVDLELVALSERARRSVRKAGDRVVVGFASGSWTHDQDFAEAAAPALRAVMRRHPEVVFRVIGPLELGPEWDELATRIERQPMVHWRELPRWLAALDINLAPLEIDNPFCQAKSELKWLEASICGVPTVATATEAFACAIEDGVTGLLARNVAEFEAALERLIADPAARQSMGEAARAFVVERRSTVGQAAGYEATLWQALCHLQPWRAPPQPMAALRIGVLLPEPARGSGGHTSIVRMVNGLTEAGHEVTVYVDRGPRFRDASEEELDRYLRQHFGLHSARVRRDHNFTPSDVLIATSWTTAMAVAMATNCRCRLYFVQDFEPFFEPMSLGNLLAEATYRLGLRHITLGPWLAEHLRRQYGAIAEAIDFGVDHDIYWPGPVDREPLVVFYGRSTTPRRGTRLGLAALREVKRLRPDIEVALYGSPEVGATADGFQQVGILQADELADLYRRATVGLALSYTNLSFVPLEMMACGCAVVANDCEPVRWFFRHGENALAVASEPQALAAAILSLLDDEVQRRALAAGGVQSVASLDWARSQRQFETLVRHFAADVGRAHRPDRRALAEPGPAEVLPVPGGAARPPAADLPAMAPSSAAPVEVQLDQLWAPGESEGLPLEEGRPITWQLPCTVDHLFRLDVQLRSEHLWPAGRLRLTLRPHRLLGPALAVSRDLADFVRDGWLAFEFPAIPDASGRHWWATLEWLGPTRPRGIQLLVDPHPEAADGRKEAAIRVGERTLAARPLMRSFGLRPGASVPASPDWSLWRPLERLRRDRAGLAVWQAELGREAIGRAVRGWRRVAAPLPPPDRRPWAQDLPPLAKWQRAIVSYGLLPALREVGAYLRYRLGTREGD